MSYYEFLVASRSAFQVLATTSTGADLDSVVALLIETDRRLAEAARSQPEER